MVNFEVNKAKQELAETLYRFQSQLGHIKTKNQTTETKFFAHRLDENEDLEFSEMMSFLGSFLNGLDNIKYAYPNDPMYEFKDLAESSVQDRIDEFPSYSKFPHGNLSEYLSNQEINFGEKRYFAFEDSKKIANIISIKRYATAMSAISLHELFKVDAEMIYTVSFLPIERGQARKKVNKVVTAMEVTNDGGETELAKLETLEDDVLSEQITLGASHVSLMVLSTSKEDLKEKTNQVQRVFGEEGFQTIVEQYNHDGAFWGQFPANFKFIARTRLIPSDVFCHFFPMQNFPTGHTHRTHLGEAICLVKTPSRTPMFFNYHTKGSGSKQEKVPGHGTIVGANNFGKTTLALVMDSLMEKYDTRLFFFDRNNGAEIYIEASKGRYIIYDFEDQGVRHNPFALEDTASNRAFVTRLLCAMVRREDEVFVPSDIANQLKECVDHAYNHIPANQRNLSTVVKISLEHSFKRREELYEYMRGDGIRPDGKYAIFFDNQEEGFDFQAYMKFGLDTTKLLKEKRLTGIITLYVFHLIMMVIERGDGKPTGLIFDEGWSYLQDPYFASELNEAIPTLRKVNTFIILATQSASSVINCPIKDIILSNMAFMILAPNSQANYQDVYQHLNISQSEFNWIKRTPVQTRQALYKQPMSNDSAIVDLGLKGFDRELAVISGSTESVEIKRKVIEDLGTNDPDVWLPEFYKRMGV
jgi:type IV secretion system protein VirB4